ncbi:Aldehyde/histidinol dehydrogenase [Melampsora americana]|nr:Aldehyde/histidinol dehydrogenase [Melampsora americana]
MNSSSKAQEELNSQFTSIDEIPKIHQELRNNFSKRITKTLEWRTHQLKQLGYLLQENESLIEEALAVDLGKPKTESHIGELVGVRHEVLHALQNVKSWMEPKSVKTDLAWLVTKPKTFHEPKGLVLIFGTWNYPISLSLIPLIGAIAGGNVVMLKLSEQAPAVAALLTKLIAQYLDHNHIRVINGAADHCNALLDLKFDHIFFTGSTQIGRNVAKRAAEHMTPVTLELGGKSPAIVFDDADFPVIARRLIWGKGMNAGQTCVAPDYILVSKKSEAKLIASLKTAMQELYPLDSVSDSSAKNIINASGKSADAPDDLQFGKIVNQNQFNRLTNVLQETKGEIVSTDGTFQLGTKYSSDTQELKMPLTLVRNLTKEDPVMQNEIFGPIFPILTYDLQSETMDDILRPISDSEPLALYVFTQSSQNFELVRQLTKSGQLVCNDLLIQFAIPGLPFGGIGQSGSGNYHGYYSFLTFTYERASANLPTWADFLFNRRYPPYTPFKLKIFSAIMGPARIKGKSNPGLVPRSAQAGKRTWLPTLTPLTLSTLLLAGYYVLSRRNGSDYLRNWITRFIGAVKQSNH